LDVIDQPVAGITRTAPPEIIELWERMSAATRQQVERKIRDAAAKKSATEFLRQIAELLMRLLPKSKVGRRRSSQRSYLERVGKIWQGLGLRIGRAYDGMAGVSVESTFQRYCRLALLAVGENTGVSGRQIVQMKTQKNK
jgi:hypothetical protein